MYKDTYPKLCHLYNDFIRLTNINHKVYFNKANSIHITEKKKYENYFTNQNAQLDQ